MSLCFFVSDLHGYVQRYRILFEKIEKEKPTAVFLGGDLLPYGGIQTGFAQKPMDNFVVEYLIPEMEKLHASMGNRYPRFFLILGNDDNRSAEVDIERGEESGFLEYIHFREATFGDFSVFGYACVPPTPFLHKDWEQYDVSRHLEPGCIAPEDGWYTFPVQENKLQNATIQEDIRKLTSGKDLGNAIFLFHSPPYLTDLDRAALDGQYIDHVPLDVHIGSVAIKRFIEERQPLFTLHGHVHESARLTGNWRTKIGQTVCLTGAHDGPELALIRFDPYQLESACRELIQW